MLASSTTPPNERARKRARARENARERERSLWPLFKDVFIFVSQPFKKADFLALLGEHHNREINQARLLPLPLRRQFVPTEPIEKHVNACTNIYTYVYTRTRTEPYVFLILWIISESYLLPFSRSNRFWGRTYNRLCSSWCLFPPHFHVNSRDRIALLVKSM